MSDSTSPAPSGDEPTDMSVGTFDPSKDSTDASDAPAESSDVEAVDAVMDALPGGGRLDEPDDDVSGPVQVA